MAITAEKLIPTPKKSSVTKGTKFRVKTISVKVNKINEILKGTLASEKKQRDKERKSEEKTTSSKAEDALEKEQKKNFKFKLPAPLKRLNPIDKIKNFLFNVLGGYVAVRLLDNLPMLKKLIPIISGAIKFIEEWGGKILNGLVTLIDNGYEMYDGLRGQVGKYFGEDGQKKFDEISGVLNKVLNGVLIAGMVALAASRFNPLGGGKGAGAAAGMRPRPGTGGRPKVTGTGGGRAGGLGLRNPFRQKPKITSGGATSRFGSRLAGKGASRVTIGASSQLGTKAGLRVLKNFISPVVKRIPIIGGLIDFALNFFVFKEPIGRAAFAAIGSTIFSALGAVAGSVIPFAGNLVGGILGGLAGDIAGKWLYDTFFSGKKPIKIDTELETTKGDRERKSSTGQSTPKKSKSRTPANMSGVQGAPLGMGEKQAFATVYELAKKYKAKFPEVVAAQAMHETGYLSDSLASVFNSTGRTNAFGQTGDRGYGTIPRKGESVGWSVYPSLEEAVRDNIILWHRTANHPENYEAFDTPIEGILAVVGAYSPNTDPANVAKGYTEGSYVYAMQKILKSMGFDPNKANKAQDLSDSAVLERVSPLGDTPGQTYNLQPSPDLSGTEQGEGTKASAKLLKDFPQIKSRGSAQQIYASGLGYFLKKTGAGRPGKGDFGDPPQSGADMEHPDHGGVRASHAGTGHNRGIALDLGGNSATSAGYNNDQKRLWPSISRYLKKYGLNKDPFIPQVLHGIGESFSPMGPSSGPDGGHNDHFHVEFHDGGMVGGNGIVNSLLKTGEIVIDNDSSISEVTPMLLAINAAKDKKGVMKAIQEYAPYDAMAPQTIMISAPSPQGQYGGGQDKSIVPVALPGSESSSAFDILYQGA